MKFVTLLTDFFLLHSRLSRLLLGYIPLRDNKKTPKKNKLLLHMKNDRVSVKLISFWYDHYALHYCQRKEIN